MSAKITAPSPQIFTSDPLEQIAMKGVDNRDMSGLNYMFLNAFGDRRRMDQDTYMAGVADSNQLASQAAEMELRQKNAKDMLAHLAKMIELGGGASGDPALAGSLQRAFIESKIAHNNRDPNGGGEMYTAKAGVGPAGGTFIDYSGKGRDPVAVAERVRQLQIEQLKRQGIDPNKAPGSLVETEKMRARSNYPNSNIPD